MSDGKWLYVGFNQDYQCFSVGTTKGFIVYDSLTSQERFQALFNKGIGIVEVLKNTNIAALVGGGRNPAFPPNKLILWDDCSERTIAEIEFPSAISGLKIHLDKIVVSLVDSVYIYDTRNFGLLKKYNTFPNPRGVMAWSGTKLQSLMVATIDDEQGYFKLVKFNPPRMISCKAHLGPVQCMCLSRDGRLLATTSEKGTLIRVFNSSGSTVKQTLEFRRGSDHADIYSMCFSPNASYLVVNSDKYNAHVFALANPELNTVSSLGGWSFGLSPTWSAAQFKLPEIVTHLAFTSETNIIAIGMDKSYFKFEIASQGNALKIIQRGFKKIDRKSV